MLIENIDPKAQKKHKGKAAPYGSGYSRVREAVAESLRDWFKKEDWVRINTSGNICLLYTSPSPRDRTRSRMPSSA